MPASKQLFAMHDFQSGMTLQREYRDGQYLVWRDYLKDGKPVTAPVDIDDLPTGVYRLT